MTGAATAEVIDLTRRLPTSEEIESAAEAATVLANARTENDALEIPGGGVRLAPAIADLMIDVLGHVARGDMVTPVPTGAMLTTRQAADILNVSRPHLAKLLKDGEIPFVSVGSHRRVALADMMTYRKRRDAARAEALDELARRGQEFDAS